MVRILSICVLSILLFSSISYAGQAAPDIIEVTQPDGTAFKARMQGDEHRHWVETAETGYTVIRNRKTGFWEYAEKGPDGKLKTSGIRVQPSGKKPPASIPKGLRPDSPNK